jgi:chromosome partitioning protein
MMCTMAIHEELTRVVTVANGKGGGGEEHHGVQTSPGWLPSPAGESCWSTSTRRPTPAKSSAMRGRGESDGGRHFVDTLIQGGALTPTLKDVRPNLDVVTGGPALDTLEDVLAGMIKRGQGVASVFADALARTATDYDLVVIDTPPTRPLLLRLALTATRWIIVPTRPGRTSIEGLRALASEIAVARQTNPELELLGALLYDVEAGATVIRRNATEDVVTVLGGAAPMFETVIRHALSPVVESEEKGMLIHEVAETVDKAEPYWKALQEGRRPERVPGSAPALAEDFVLLTQEILTSIDARERAQTAEATA